MVRARTRIFFLVLALSSLQSLYSFPIGLPNERNSHEAEQDFEKRPASGRTNDPTLAEEKAELFEGDIDIDEGTKRALIGDKLMPRDALISPIYYWPEATIPYDFDVDFPDETRTSVHNAMDFISRKTCIRFKLRKNESSYVKFIQGNGCYSRVGRDPTQKMQKISIGVGCELAGTIEHEISHALGFFHEHTRPDRGKYIRIMYDNIKPIHMYNFKKYARALGSNFGKPYDENSVMHYSKLAFSKNGEETIQTLNPRDKIGQRIRLSSCDIYQLNKVYCDGPNTAKLLKKCKWSRKHHIFFDNEEIANAFG